ncbi:MAG TPA: O-antigen ligase family protein [Edaphobacter sp.]|uniref:O-antigen ligase family protein n=1 Tax=Edaphobacter sp. TaxID=1934404 RepID=UPI002BB8590B|nr:O-antigen ligase family protein [Edaphobacter sp.]HUZ97522.1 O-antigen ligase family protein [Edaphobacter sp.]
MKLIHRLFTICLFTASFDIFLAFKLGGTVRIAQLIMVLVCFGALAKAAQEGRIWWPRGGWWLALWCFVQVLFLPLSVDFGFSLGYLLFLLFTAAGFYAVAHLYARSCYIEPLMKAYLCSYVFVAAFGIFQLVSPILHLGDFLVVQWIVGKRWPRINGFSYEPSYFATYLIMGWIALVDLRYSKAHLTAARKWFWLTIFVGAVLFLSTSKTGWIFMAVEGVVRAVPYVIRWGRRMGTRLSAGSLIFTLPRWKLVVLSVTGSILLLAGVVALGLAVNLNILLSGTGLNHTASHSVSDRYDGFIETVQVFEEHPFLGRSLGGVSSRIAQLHGVPNDGKTYLGFPVIMDLLAASGLIGIIPFLMFIWVNSFGMFGLIRKRWPDERAKWLRALVRALFYESFMLLADQNVLRLYVWFHLSIIAAVALHLRYEDQDCNREKPLMLAV